MKPFIPRPMMLAAWLAVGLPAAQATDRIFSDRFEVQQCCTLGGEVSGLASGKSVALHMTAGAATEDLVLTTNGAWQFGATLAAGSAYSVSVLTQPQGQTCTVGPATGTIDAMSRYALAVSCGSGASMLWDQGKWGDNWN